MILRHLRVMLSFCRKVISFFICFLLFCHVAVGDFSGGEEALFDGSGAGPADEIQHAAGLVVGA